MVLTCSSICFQDSFFTFVLITKSSFWMDLMVGQRTFALYVLYSAYLFSFQLG